MYINRHPALTHSPTLPSFAMIAVQARDPKLAEVVQRAKAATDDVADLGVAARYQALARVVARALGGAET